MVAFPTADAAFQAAMDMQQRVLNLPPVSGVKLNIRVGFHFGPTIEENNDLFGDTVNTAKRLCDAAASGELLVSQAACAAAGLPAGPPREVQAKGKRAPLLAQAFAL